MDILKEKKKFLRKELLELMDEDSNWFMDNIQKDINVFGN